MRISQILILLILLFVPFSGCIGENQSSTLNTQESDTLPMTWMINDYDTGVTYDFLEHSREFQDQKVYSDKHIFFVTEFKYNGSNFIELWKSDGSLVGTKVVYSGSEFIGLGVFFDGYLYFSADNDIHGTELWKTDGTFGGTVLVKDINYGEGHSYPSNFVIFNDELFFTTHPGVYGANKEVIIWKTDGTDSGTVPISNMSFYQLGHFTPLNDKLIFIDFGGSNLYAMNQTNYEISLLSSTDWQVCVNNDETDLCSVYIHSSAHGYTKKVLPVINGKVIFSGIDGINGAELWESDGTIEGTSLLKIINPITKQDRENSPIGDEIWEDSNIGPFIISTSGQIYFWAFNGSKEQSQSAWDYWGTQHRIWTTDGTENETKEISLTSNLSKNKDSSDLIVVSPSGGGQAARQRASLWIVQNEFELYEFNNLSNDSYDNNKIFVIGEHIFGTIYNDTFGNEFGKSDGTPNGTILIKDIYSGNESSYPEIIGIINDVLLFEADDGNGTALWAHRVANNQVESGISDDSLTKDIELFVNKFKSFILPVIGVIVLFVLLVNLKRIYRRKKESLELEELDTEFDEYVRDFFPNSNSNKPARTNISEFKSDDKPPYSFKGEINEDGWEICEYPGSSEIWWWKDYETETWVLWE